MNTKLFNKKNEIEQALLAFKSTFWTVGTFSAITNLLMLVPSLYMLQVYDRVLASRNELTLVMLTVLMLGAYLLMVGLELVRSYVLVRVGAKFDMQMNKRIYTGLRAEPEAGGRQRGPGAERPDQPAPVPDR
jgi:ATP-binding cassette subfamily C exporter for protease/lipase